MMALVELARLRESSVEAHYIHRTVFLVGEVLICEMEPSNRHSDWAIVVKEPCRDESGCQCHRINCRPEKLSRRQNFLGNSVALNLRSDRIS